MEHEDPGHPFSDAVAREYASQPAPDCGMELDAEDRPRYAVFLADQQHVLLTSDPGSPGRALPLGRLCTELAQPATASRPVRLPSVFVVTSAPFLESARRGRFLHGLFWLLQAWLEQRQTYLAAARVTEELNLQYCLRFRHSPIPLARPWPAAEVLMLSTAGLRECLTAPSGLWPILSSSQATDRSGHLTTLQYAEPQLVPGFYPDAFQALDSLIEELGPQYRDARRVAPELGAEACGAPELTSSTAPLYPGVFDNSRVRVGYVLSACECAGAERVMMNLARESQRRGWLPHLFILGSATARLPAEFKDSFDCITVIDDPGFCSPDGLSGLLSGLDVVVANDCPLLVQAAEPLRRRGTAIFWLVHSIKSGERHMDDAPSSALLPSEENLDGVLVTSTCAHAWCRAKGISEAKLIHLPVAPGFEMSDVLAQVARIERTRRPPAEPLHVLHLGRLSLEDGVDRLVELCGRPETKPLPVTWQIIDRPVGGEAGPDPRELALIQPFLRPVARTAAALERLYAWADAVIVLSRSEGACLTIVEAQRFGCVVLSTRVGGVEELIDQGKTGFLFSSGLDSAELADQIVSCLQRLYADRTYFGRLSSAAADLRAGTTWSPGFERFARAIETNRAGIGAG